MSSIMILKTFAFIGALIYIADVSNKNDTPNSKAGKALHTIQKEAGFILSKIKKYASFLMRALALALGGIFSAFATILGSMLTFALIRGMVKWLINILF